MAALLVLVAAEEVVSAPVRQGVLEPRLVGEEAPMVQRVRIRGVEVAALVQLTAEVVGVLEERVPL